MSAGLDEQLSEAIARIYESATSDSAFDGLMDALDRAFPRTRVGLVMYHRTGDRLDAVARSTFERQDSYEAYYKDLNPWLAAQMTIEVGRLFHTDEILDRDALYGSEFHNDFLRGQRGLDLVAGIGAVVHRDARGFVTFATHYDPRYENDPDDLVRLRSAFGRLIPHMQRAWALRRRFAFLNERVRNLENLLDAIDDAVFHVNAQGRIIYANSEAKRLLGDGGALRASSTNVLGCLAQEDEDALRAAVHRASAMKVGPAGNRVGVVAIRRRNATPLAAFTAPLRSADMLAGLDPERPSVVVFVADPRRRRVPPEQVLELILGLTPAEAKVTVALASGMTPREFANSRGVSHHTVRNQVHTILNKTGCGRQSELVALVSRCLSPIGDDGFRRLVHMDHDPDARLHLNGAGS